MEDFSPLKGRYGDRERKFIFMCDVDCNRQPTRPQIKKFHVRWCPGAVKHTFIQPDTEVVTALKLSVKNHFK